MRYFLLLLGVICFQLTEAQCEDSIVNCTGECGKFTDDNNDLICDNSIIDSSFLHKDETIVPDKPNKASIQKPEKKLTGENKATHLDNPKPDSISIIQVKQEQAQPIPSQVQQKKKHNNVPYHFFSIALPLIGLYILLQWLSNQQKIKKASFFKIWNMLLLITFVITALLGLVLTVKLIYHIQIPFIKSIYLVHVDVGVAMSVITLFHLARHWKYYKNLVK